MLTENTQKVTIWQFISRPVKVKQRLSIFIAIIEIIYLIFTLSIYFVDFNRAKQTLNLKYVNDCK